MNVTAETQTFPFASFKRRRSRSPTTDDYWRHVASGAIRVGVMRLTAPHAARAPRSG